MLNAPPRAPLVSVVIPCFNRAHLIGDAVGSVLAQTLDDWELIVVDDASVDDLAARLRERSADPRIRLLRHEHNRGVSAARNTGVAAARGRFVAFLDSDDAWMPHKLERQLATALATADPERALCVTLTRVDMRGGWSRVRPLSGPAEGQSLAEWLYVDGGFAQCSSFFVPTALARTVPFREGLRQYEDHLFFAELGAAGARYVLVPELLTVWHNDDRPDRLGSRDDLARADSFVQAAAGVLSARARLAFEARAVFHLHWQRSPVAATALMWRAWRGGALTARRAATLYLRNLVPSPLLQAIRRLANRTERVGPAASA